MKKILGIALSLLSCSVFAATDISGTYQCGGHDAYASKDYSDGKLVIKKTGDTYDFAWTYPQEKLNTTGTGFFDSSNDTYIPVLFQINNKQIGLVYYKVTDDQLQGHWVYKGKETLGDETCKKINATAVT